MIFSNEAQGVRGRINLGILSTKVSIFGGMVGALVLRSRDIWRAQEDLYRTQV